MSKNLLSVVLIILLLVGLALYAYINRFEIIISNVGILPAVVQFDRWTGQAKVKNILYELEQSLKDGDRNSPVSQWITIRERSSFAKYRYEPN